MEYRFGYGLEEFATAQLAEVNKNKNPKYHVKSLPVGQGVLKFTTYKPGVAVMDDPIMIGKAIEFALRNGFYDFIRIKEELAKDLYKKLGKELLALGEELPPGLEMVGERTKFEIVF